MFIMSNNDKQMIEEKSIWHRSIGHVQYIPVDKQQNINMDL